MQLLLDDRWPQIWPLLFCRFFLLLFVLSVLSPTVVAAGITVRVAASSYVGFLKSLSHHRSHLLDCYSLT